MSEVERPMPDVERPVEVDAPAAAGHRSQLAPVEDLPESPFVLDAFKREFSNTDGRSVAAPYLLGQFDNAGWTCWWCDYKYNEELTLQFKTANLVRGWHGGMGAVRKQAFGVTLIVGDGAAHAVRSLWILRGKGLPAAVAALDDTELYSWEEITDPAAEAGKITDYLSGGGASIGGPVLEARTFK
jgi:elongation factor 1-gamma